MNQVTPPTEPPMALLAEITHRCPMRCLYCSNPLELERAAQELDTATWIDVIGQAAQLGVLQIHFSGGEPTARKDLVPMVEAATKAGIYSNLITSAVLLDQKMVAELAQAGLSHAQISFQDIDERGEIIGGLAGAHAKKIEAARLLSQAGIALTANAVITRHNIDRVQEMIDFAVQLGARRVEVANVQYYGWGLKNRAYLIPSPQQMESCTKVVLENRDKLKGILVIDYVIPDYYAKYPKSCMGGWAKRFVNITPSGQVVPCHAAETIPGLDFANIKTTSLREIWYDSPAFNQYRGTAWMPEPCSSCDRREIDWGGCRCQAMALAGDAGTVDPTCEFSPFHDRIRAMAEDEALADSNEYYYRQF
jgi:PqqA peptide cyclase